MSRHRLIAINLPQFHPFKENDEWWGKGFTEWTNVTKAKPRFKGHYQPHLPADTGFYDLRLPEARQMQAEMAKEYGIYGFCYYHYWFNGHRLMERPVNEILSSGTPDFPFMLCWANENWSRTWDGGENQTLMRQNYCHDDDVNHMKYLCEEVFPDPRYIRVNGNPFFVVYHPELMQDAKRTVDTWRKIASSYGIKLYLGFMRCRKSEIPRMIANGFDVHVDFLPRFENSHPLEYYKGCCAWLFYRMKYRLYRMIHHKDYPNQVYVKDYQELIDEQVPTNNKPYKEYPMITPGWDNSPRRVNTHFWVLINNTPYRYGQWLRKILSSFVPHSKEENFVFINAWNEWAEGNHLEPDIKWGKDFLEETKRAIEKDIL